MTADMKTQTFLQSLLQKLFTGALISLAVSLLVTLGGWLAGWRTAIQFSNGFFIAGSVVVIFGIIAVWGGFTARGSFALTYAQSVSDMTIVERGKLWMLDSLRGYNAVVVATICGIFLIGLSILTFNLFG